MILLLCLLPSIMASDIVPVQNRLPHLPGAVFVPVPDRYSDWFECRVPHPNLSDTDVLLSIRRFRPHQGEYPHYLSMRLVGKGQRPDDSPFLGLSFVAHKDEVEASDSAGHNRHSFSTSYHRARDPPKSRQKYDAVKGFFRERMDSFALHPDATKEQRTAWDETMKFIRRALD